MKASKPYICDKLITLVINNKFNVQSFIEMENENKNNAAEQVKEEKAQQQKKCSFPVKAVATTAVITAAVVDGIIRKDKSVVAVASKWTVKKVKGLVTKFGKKDVEPEVEIPVCEGNPCPYSQQNNNQGRNNNGGNYNNNRR